MNKPWRVVYTKDAIKDKAKAYEAGYGNKIEQLLALMKENPFTPYPPYEKLIGDLNGMYSRRFNHQYRLVYLVYIEEKAIKIISVWSYYE